MKNKNKQTKFPVARIKKIMQKDEEVGKVAQATPIVISKSLELFLALIIEQASNITVERGSKKVEAYHLKHAIETTEILDFLKEIVEAVPDPSAGGTIDLENEATEGKRKRGKSRKTTGEPGTVPKRRRKKKGEDPDTTGGEQEHEAGVADGGEGEGGSKSEPEHEREYDYGRERDGDRDGDGDGDVTMKANEPRSRKQQKQYQDESLSEDDWDSNKPYIPRR